MLQCCNRYSIRQGGALRQNFVEPIIMLCIREIHVRMLPREYEGTDNQIDEQSKRYKQYTCHISK